jgi:hypothetical protein
MYRMLHHLPFGNSAIVITPHGVSPAMSLLRNRTHGL